jgi:hypothetical protein
MVAADLLFVAHIEKSHMKIDPSGLTQHRISSLGV